MVSRTAPEVRAADVKVLAKANRHYQVREADLPLSCPMPDMPLWDSHPRIWLPLAEAGGSAQCTYCGTRFERVCEARDNGA